MLFRSSAGLAARDEINSMGDSEVGFLGPLYDIVDSGMTTADTLLAQYHGEWGGDLGRVYGDKSF